MVTTADAEWPEQIRRVAAGRPLDVIIDPAEYRAQAGLSHSPGPNIARPPT